MELSELMPYFAGGRIQDALPLIDAETLTPQWYAIQIHGPSGPSNVFGILDFSEGEVGRCVYLLAIALNFVD